MSPNLIPSAGPAPASLADAHRVVSGGLAPAPYMSADPAREYLQFVLGVLRRRCWFLLAFVAIVAAIAAFAVNELKPLYQSETQLVLEPSGGRSAASGLQALLGAGGDLESETEAAVITSLGMAERVIGKLQLREYSFFGGSQQPPSALAVMWNEARHWIADQLPADYRDLVLPASAGAPSNDEANGIYERFMRNLVVRAGDRSRVITIRFNADNPKLAALIANTLTDTYITDQVDARRQNSSRETRFLDQKVEELRER